MNKTDWKIPHLEIKKGEWYVCTNDWSDDGWNKFQKGDVVQAVEDYAFLDCYGIKKTFKADGICYFRPADKDEIPECARLKDIELNDFEKALSHFNIEGESFICSHDEIECKHETRRIAKELLQLARKILEHGCLEKQGEQKPTMIQWKGDNLKEVIDFTGVYKEGFEKWFHNSWEEYEKYVHEHNNIFKIFNEDGSHIEVPIGAWIVKTPDGYNTASRYVFRQNHADKVEPKFKVGDWLIRNDIVGVACCIAQIHEPYYYLTNNNSFIKFGEEDNYRPWTIQDAKAGDVLTSDNKCPFIYRTNTFFGNPVAYCGVRSDGVFISNSPVDHQWCLKSKVVPATKEQRDLLFQKMHDAGYEWDAEKKELRKVEHTAWSEEDETKLTNIIIMLKEGASHHFNINDITKAIDWLKSIKGRVGCEADCTTTWKPSEEQISVLSRSLKYINTISPNYCHVLEELLNQLKKLKG